MKSLFSLIGLLLPVAGLAQTEVQPDSLVCSPISVSNDSLYVPLQSPVVESGIYRPFGLYGIIPFGYGFSTWELHKGFNASIGLNLTFSPSRYAPSGVGFGQDAAFMYAVPVSNRISIAGGLYASNMNWGFVNYQQVGIAGVAAFQLTDRISFTAYGVKSLTPQRPQYYYPLPNYNPDRFGGMFNFKIGESAAISIGVESRQGNTPWWY